MNNAFATYGGSFAKPVRVARPRNLRAVQQEEAQLRKEANAADRRQLAEVLAGPHGPAIGDLQRVCRKLALEGAPALVAYIEKAKGLRSAPADIRYLALRIIDRAIVRARCRADLPPFDDGIGFGGPAEPPKAHALIRDMLGV